MRADRVFPPTASTGIDGGLPLYSNGFGSPLIGNPRAEPTSGLGTIKVQQLSEGVKPLAASAAGDALASSSSATPLMDFARQHWLLLVAAGLVVGYLVVK